jgi:hypothetical protein
MLRNAKAKVALQKEWDKLRAAGKVGTWDESKVRSKKEVQEEARRTGVYTHFGKIFEICVEKNYQLDESDPSRKYKGRVVYSGDKVKEEYNMAEILQDMASCPATMEAAKALDCYALFPGNKGQMADAESAYTQALFKGAPTWVSIPKHQWPAAWRDLPYDDPVCPLVLALYGHPESGGYWEQHCEAHLLSVGFENIPGNAWPSCYWHPKLELFCVVYVDDFKLAGPEQNLEAGWKLIRSHIKMEDPASFGLYLGWYEEEFELELEGAQGGKVRGICYNAEPYMKKCVDRYLEIAGPATKLPYAATPFATGNTDQGVFAPEGTDNWIECPWCVGRFGEKYFTCGKGTTIKRQGDQLLNWETVAERKAKAEANKGQLAPNAMKVPSRPNPASTAWPTMASTVARVLMCSPSGSFNTVCG